MTKVELALEGLINPDDLNANEQELYFEKLAESYWAPSPIEDKYFADLRARGGNVGMDEAGNIIFSEPSKSNAPHWEADPARAVTADQLRANINPDGSLPLVPSKVERALEGPINPDDLSDDEQELYFEKLGESHRAASPIEDKFFADLRARGGLVGMDEAGTIIFSEPSKSTAL